MGDASNIAAATTKISFEGKDTTMEPETVDSSTDLDEDDVEEEYSGSGDVKLDRSVERLKSRVEGMIGKIEKQLSDVQLKIGNKLHLLDKDMDGVLTREEMTECLQQVLKRRLTSEMAMAIVNDMDSNEDGLITVAELINWIDTHRFVKLAEEGRDADLDKEIIKKMDKLSVKDDDGNVVGHIIS